ARKIRGDAAPAGTLDVPPADGLALAVGPADNPGSADRIRVRYSAPGAGSARIELIDLRGRVLDARGVAIAGAHDIELAPASRPAPGVYMLRIRQGGRQRVARVTLLR